MEGAAQQQPPARKRPSLGCELDSIEVDWLLIKHDEGENTRQATINAFEYLRTLRTSIPIPEVATACTTGGRSALPRDEEDPKVEDVPYGGWPSEVAYRERRASLERAGHHLLDCELDQEENDELADAGEELAEGAEASEDVCAISDGALAAEPKGRRGSL